MVPKNIKPEVYTYGDLIAEMLKLIPPNTPDWGNQSESDPGHTLVEMIRFLSEALVQGSEALSDEAFLDLAKFLGFSMRPAIPAIVELQFQFTGDIDRGTIFEPGIQVSTSDGKIHFETVQSVVVLEPNVVLAEHGCTIFDEQIKASNGRPKQRFKLRHRPVLLHADYEKGAEICRPEITLHIIEDGRRHRWMPVACLRPSKPKSRHYELDPRTGEVQFGDGEHGRVPPRGSTISASYRTGGGASGNVGAQSVIHLVDPIPGLTVTNPKAAMGGADAETLEEARKRIAREMRHRGRSVTCADYVSSA